ncbi:hypothetical protein ACTG9Q_14975 [Actinokineospora sp. 24-640]
MKIRIELTGRCTWPEFTRTVRVVVLVLVFVVVGFAAGIFPYLPVR